MIKEGSKVADFCPEGIDEFGNEGQFCLSDFLSQHKDIILLHHTHHGFDWQRRQGQEDLERRKSQGAC